VIHEIGLVDAAVLPVLAGPERGLRLILPLLSLPFKEADRGILTNGQRRFSISG